MTRHVTCVAAFCAVSLFAGASTALAQAWTDRGYVSVNVGRQPTAQTIAEGSTFSLYGENGSFAATHTIDAGRPLYDGSIGARVWKNLALGVGFSSVRANVTSAVVAQVPSPLAFDSPRTASASAAAGTHSETAVHFQILWMIPVSSRFQVAAIVGPSLLKVEQDLVSGVTTAEAGAPFTSVNIASVQTTTQSKNALALTAGVDATVLITKHLGVGGFVRESRVSGGGVDMPSLGGSTVRVSAGGLQAGGGLRFRF